MKNGCKQCTNVIRSMTTYLKIIFVLIIVITIIIIILSLLCLSLLCLSLHNEYSTTRLECQNSAVQHLKTVFYNATEKKLILTLHSLYLRPWRCKVGLSDALDEFWPDILPSAILKPYILQCYHISEKYSVNTIFLLFFGFILHCK